MTPERLDDAAKKRLKMLIEAYAEATRSTLYEVECGSVKQMRIAEQAEKQAKNSLYHYLESL